MCVVGGGGGRRANLLNPSGSATEYPEEKKILINNALYRHVGSKFDDL